MDLSDLPHINAALNATSTLLLLLGLIKIKQRRIAAHKRCMLGAFAASTLFLVCYVTHYAWRVSVSGEAHTPYHGEGALRAVYYSMLISHIILAMVVPVVAVWLIRLGLAQRYETHRRVARVGFPVWLYVSVTGVLIYMMLYHWNPASTL